jgi:hypothetical protein
MRYVEFKRPESKEYRHRYYTRERDNYIAVVDSHVSDHALANDRHHGVVKIWSFNWVISTCETCGQKRSGEGHWEKSAVALVEAVDLARKLNDRYNAILQMPKLLIIDETQEKEITFELAPFGVNIREIGVSTGVVIDTNRLPNVCDWFKRLSKAYCKSCGKADKVEYLDSRHSVELTNNSKYVTITSGRQSVHIEAILIPKLCGWFKELSEKLEVLL